MISATLKTPLLPVLHRDRGPPVRLRATCPRQTNGVGVAENADLLDDRDVIEIAGDEQDVQVGIAFESIGRAGVRPANVPSPSCIWPAAS